MLQRKMVWIVWSTFLGSRDRYESDRYRDGQRWDSDRYDGGRERYRERYDDRDRREYDRGI